MHTSIRSVTFAFALAALMLAAVLPCRAENGKEGDDASARKPMELGPDRLPIYKHPYDNGFYSTVTAMYYCGTPQEYMKANFRQGGVQVPGFSKIVPVSYIKQSFPAPLVVVLLGGDGEVKGPFGELYPYWFGHAGFNVLTFDNAFTPRFPDFSGRGPVGNFEQDTESVVAIIDAYIKQDPKNFTRVGVVGLSFGGSQALIMATMGKQGKLPFELSGCLAFSPPVKLLGTAKLVDGYFKKDRQNVTMIELGKKFGNHKPVESGPIPFKDEEMKGALGFAFRDQLKQVVDRNDRIYGMPELTLPKANNGDDRNAYLEGTSLQRYLQLGTANFYLKKGMIASAQQLWEMPNLDRLLPMLPDYAEVVIAQNDPMNFPGDLESVKAQDSANRIIVLPRGGHLGMITSEWALIKAHHLFDKVDGPLKPGPAEATVQPASSTVKKTE